MTKRIKLIEIKEEILSENKGLANILRKLFDIFKVFFLNIIGSPGDGKTSLIVKRLKLLATSTK